MRRREDEALNARHDGTNERSAAALVDQPTERALYRLYQAFFRDGDTRRTWNLWNDIPWKSATDGVAPAADPALVERVLTSYKVALMVPDYCAASLANTRASRGRAWFFTRWSYEEGKRLLTLSEWLRRNGGVADDSLRNISESQLTRERWTPAFDDAAALIVDTLVFELAQLEEDAALLSAANDAGDDALAAAANFFIRDDTAHRDLLRDILHEIHKSSPELIADAIDRVVRFHDAPPESARQLAEYVG